MTYDEMLDEQKSKFAKLAKALDGFRCGYSGPDKCWDILYPIRGKKEKWGRCYACRYKMCTSFGFANRLRAHYDTSTKAFEFDLEHVWHDRLGVLSSADHVLAWLDDVKRDPTRANNCMATEYPNDERKGYVPRFVAERYIPDFYSISAKLGKRQSERFVKIFDSGFCWHKDNAQVENMTANKFFEYCRIAYLAAEEKGDHLDRSLSGREMYKRYSDGRYGALLAIDPDSPEQFLKWLDGKVPWDKFGGDHPWEIKRGGNTTHIDLYVRRLESYRWYATDKEREEAKVSNKVVVGLRGHHIGRIVETIRMFLALHEAGLPIWIEDAASIRNRILALDNVGIIPESESLHRGWQEFPRELEIADVMHFSEFGRARRWALPHVTWMSLPPLLPVPNVGRKGNGGRGRAGAAVCVDPGGCGRSRDAHAAVRGGL